MNWNASLYDNSHSFVAKYGEGILSYLHPNPGEVILDLGCGTGDLTNEISLSGARVVGVDSSAEMIEKAKSKFPSLEFYQMDARELKFDYPFDAIFSNAVLHWIREKEVVIRQMYSLLKDGGRIVVEFGGKGNVGQMLKVLRDTLANRGYTANASIDLWYYPSVGEYSTELERQNFRVIHAEHFNRITPLKGGDGMKDWFVMFAGSFFAGIGETERAEILNEVQRKLAPTHLKDGVWQADYKRLRVVATRDVE